MMAMINRNYVDPANEALRKDFERPPDIEEIVTTLTEKTRHIHAGYLFEDYGRDALKQLCLCLSGTKSSCHYKGWEDFAIGLGLNHLEVKCIDLRFNLEDPALYTLRAFVQKHDSTIDKIIMTLKNIKRFDIINIMADRFTRLADDVLRNQSKRNGEESGFSSMHSGSEYEYGENNFSHNIIIRPPFDPFVPLPLVLQEVRPIIATTESEPVDSTIVNEKYQTRSSGDVEESAKKNTYCKKVMLTFASDGLNLAKEVADIFRREKENEQRIGVLILNDHAGLVNSNPQEFIFSCFDQVDYVVPIITEGYLKAVSSLKSNSMCESSLLCIDPKYVKYIFTLMNTNYLQKSCLNDKVRCLIPDESVNLIHQKILFRGPLFQAWCRLSEIVELKQRMCGSKV